MSTVRKTITLTAKQDDWIKAQIEAVLEALPAAFNIP